MKFYKYQIATWDGKEGVILRTDAPIPGTPVHFVFATGHLYFTEDGRITSNSPVSLVAVEEKPKTVRRKVRSDLKCGVHYGFNDGSIYALDRMIDMGGKEFDVQEVAENGNILLGGYWFNPEMLEPLKSETKQPENGFKLSEWHRKELGEYIISELRHSVGTNFFDKLESILSSPEPPKWEPKQGEAVLVRFSAKDKWSARVATGHLNETYDYQGLKCNTWKQCRPFDISLIGTSDNP